MVMNMQHPQQQQPQQNTVLIAQHNVGLRPLQNNTVILANNNNGKNINLINPNNNNNNNDININNNLNKDNPYYQPQQLN